MDTWHPKRPSEADCAFCQCGGSHATGDHARSKVDGIFPLSCPVVWGRWSRSGSGFLGLGPPQPLDTSQRSGENAARCVCSVSTLAAKCQLREKRGQVKAKERKNRVFRSESVPVSESFQNKALRATSTMLLFAFSWYLRFFVMVTAAQAQAEPSGDHCSAWQGWSEPAVGIRGFLQFSWANITNITSLSLRS